MHRFYEDFCPDSNTCNVLGLTVKLATLLDHENGCIQNEIALHKAHQNVSDKRGIQKYVSINTINLTAYSEFILFYFIV